jgi:hypothetical protein
VVYLGIDQEGLPLVGKAGDLAAAIREQAASGRYFPAESGFFVPIIDLIGHLTGLAEYIYEETVYNSRLEISGGLIFLNREGIILPVPPQSSFRMATRLIDLLVNLREGETRRVYLGPVIEWRVIRQGDKFEIHTPSSHLVAPALDLVAAAQDAAVQIRQFAGRISPLLLAFKDPFITDQAVRSVFGFID